MIKTVPPDLCLTGLLFGICCFFSAGAEGSPCREAVNGQGKGFLSWEQAVLKVRSAGVSSRREYLRWQKDHPDMPSRPDRVYAKHWRTWRFFFGTEFLSWEQAVLKVRSARVSSVKEYQHWQKDHPDMPSRPESFYRDHWRNWWIFLGTL